MPRLDSAHGRERAGPGSDASPGAEKAMLVSDGLHLEDAYFLMQDFRLS